MGEMLKFLVRWIVQPVATYIFGRAALTVAHSYEWRPDDELARLIVRAAPTSLDVEMAGWLIALAIAGALWFVSDFFIYRRAPGAERSVGHSEADLIRAQAQLEHVRRLQGKQELRRQELARETAALTPNWPIRNLFFHIKPDVLDVNSGEPWREVGRLIKDQLALGTIAIWGRPLNGTEERLKNPWPTWREIPRAYWHDADFSYMFFPETDHDDVAHTYPSGTTGVRYADLRVNEEQAKAAFPAAALPPNLVPVRDALEIVVAHFAPEWGIERIPGSHITQASDRLREAAARGQVTIEGREEINRDHPMGERFSKIWAPIDKGFWKTHELKLAVALDPAPRWQDCETQPENPLDVSAAARRGFAGLRVDATDVRRQWPVASVSSDQDGERRKLLSKARAFLAEDAKRARGTKWDFGERLEQSDFYFSLRPYLSDGFRKAMTSRGLVFRVGSASSRLSGLAQLFADEIDKLEEQWRLRN